MNKDTTTSVYAKGMIKSNTTTATTMTQTRTTTIQTTAMYDNREQKDSQLNDNSYYQARALN
jgi:hypothetical protein